MGCKCGKYASGVHIFMNSRCVIFILSVPRLVEAKVSPDMHGSICLPMSEVDYELTRIHSVE